MTEGDPNDVAAHCPNCGAEYRAEFEACADCGSALEPGPARTESDEPAQPMTDAWADATHRVWDRKPSEGHPEPVELCELPTDQAHLLAGLLEAEGLEIDVLDNDVGRLGVGPAIRTSRVWVHKNRLEEAERVEKEFIERQAYE